MKISAVITADRDINGLERCLKTVEGWVNEIIIPASGSIKIDQELINKYKLRIIHCNNGKGDIAEQGIKASNSDWVLVLEPDEEVSIPLKREILTNLPQVKKDFIKVPIIVNSGDVWKIENRKVRLFRRCAGEAVPGYGIFINPIRHYKDFIFPGNPVTAKEIRSILVIKMRGLGDTVLMTPLLQTLKSYYLNASITCAVKPGSEDVLSGNPYVERIIICKSFLNAFFKIAFSRKYDIVLCPQASRSAAILGLVSRAPLRVINNHNGKNYFTTMRVKKPEEYEDAVDRDLDCARALGLPVKIKKVKVYTAKNATLDLVDHGSAPSRLFAGISVSASKKNKMWAKERYAELADKLIKDNGYKVIFFDDPSDPEALKQVLDRMKNKPCFVSEKKLGKVIQLISKLDVFIGNDSGLAHIAAGLDIPTVTIIGPDEPKIFHPYSEKDRHFILNSVQNCKPCWKDSCDFPVCLDNISVSEVLDAVKKAVS